MRLSLESPFREPRLFPDLRPCRTAYSVAALINTPARWQTSASYTGAKQAGATVVLLESWRKNDSLIGSPRFQSFAFKDAIQ